MNYPEAAGFVLCLFGMAIGLVAIVVALNKIYGDNSDKKTIRK